MLTATEQKAVMTLADKYARQAVKAYAAHKTRKLTATSHARTQVGKVAAKADLLDLLKEVG